MEVSTDKTQVRQLLTKYLQALNAEGFTSVHLSHLGEINQDIINSFTASVEEMMISAGEKKPSIKRVFSILLEGLQNILLHGADYKGEQLALVIVASNEQFYRIELGNYAPKSERARLLSYLEKLNSMTEEEVKEYYFEVLNNGLISSKGGAGLGFITMRIKSRALLSYDFEDSGDDLIFFSISTKLARKPD